MAELINSLRAGYELGEQMKNAPQRNALVGMTLDSQRQTIDKNNQLISQGKTEFDQTQAVSRARVISGTLDALSRIPEAGRRQALLEAKPYLDKFGATPPDLNGMALDDQSLEKYKASVSGLLNDPSQMAKIMPNDAREYEYFKNLPPEQKSEYLTRKRADQLAKFNDVTARIDPLSGNAYPVQTPGLTGSQADIQSQLSNQEAEKQKSITESKGQGKLNVENRELLPQMIATADSTINVLDKALNHPGLDVATGASSKLDPRNFTPGTDAYDFNVLMDQVQGKTFLAAFESLKGGGQITEVEGKKAENAIARLNRAQSKPEFVEALEELKEIVQSSKGRAIKKVNGGDKSDGKVGMTDKEADDYINSIIGQQ